MTRRNHWTHGMAFGIVWAVACAPTQPSVKPTDMSVEQHRAEAQRERELAAQDAKSYRPSATRVVAGPPPRAFDNGSGVEFPVTVYNPTDGYLAKADRHRAHAREHEKAAATLEKFESGACRQFPEGSRAACPLLGPVTQIEDVGHGVRVTFAPGTRVDAVTAHMRCHYAYAQVHGFAESVSCPLYMPGLEIRQTSPRTVDLTIANAALVEDLRARSREEAISRRSPGAEAP